MKDCFWNCLKMTFGLWGAVAILGVLLVLLGGAIAASGGTAIAGLTGLVTASLETAIGTAGAWATAAGGAGILASLVGCIVGCFTAT